MALNWLSRVSRIYGNLVLFGGLDKIQIFDENGSEVSISDWLIHGGR
jgi:hypothetical protein